ncbi:MAG: DUF4491 family protein [Bacteroidales bacterium]|nr:DUF4491 family protein [Bacteroidales bacterium]
MNYEGLILGLVTFLVIGLFHPLVIKGEYYFGVKCWWVFLLCGIGAGIWSLYAESIMASAVLGVISFSCFWSILEIYEQRERVRKGWFPRNPKRKYDSSYDEKD